jgi:hypothetical protein
LSSRSAAQEKYFDLQRATKDSEEPPPPSSWAPTVSVSEDAIDQLLFQESEVLIKQAFKQHTCNSSEAELESCNKVLEKL